MRMRYPSGPICFARLILPTLAVLCLAWAVAWGNVWRGLQPIHSSGVSSLAVAADVESQVITGSVQQVSDDPTVCGDTDDLIGPTVLQSHAFLFFTNLN